MTIKSVEQAAMKLPPSARGQLAAALLDSLENDAAEIQHAWIKEADRRLKAYKKGRTSAMPSKQAIALARKTIQR